MMTLTPHSAGECHLSEAFHHCFFFFDLPFILHLPILTLRYPEFFLFSASIAEPLQVLSKTPHSIQLLPLDLCNG